MTTTQLRAAPEEEAEAVTEVFFGAADFLGLSGREIAQILGVSESTVSRGRTNPTYLSSDQNRVWEAAILFIRAYRSLRVIVNSQLKEKVWLNSYNNALNGIPLELMQSMEGLVDVVRYLDFSRGGF